MSWTYRKKANAVLVGCLILGSVNAIGLYALGPSFRNALHANVAGPYYLALRTFMFRPPVLILYLALLALAVHWAWKQPASRDREMTKLGILAMAIYSAIGTFLTLIFRL